MYFSTASRTTQATDTFRSTAIRSSSAYSSSGKVTDARGEFVGLGFAEYLRFVVDMGQTLGLHHVTPLWCKRASTIAEAPAERPAAADLNESSRPSRGGPITHDRALPPHRPHRAQLTQWVPQPERHQDWRGCLSQRTPLTDRGVCDPRKCQRIAPQNVSKLFP